MLVGEEAVVNDLLPLGALVLLLTTAAFSQSSPAVEPTALVGVWKLEPLNAVAETPPVRLVIESADGGSLHGTLGGAVIRAARVDAQKDTVHFAFVTRDDRGDHHTSGALRRGLIEARTYSPEVGPLLVWRALPDRAPAN